MTTRYKIPLTDPEVRHMASAEGEPITRVWRLWGPWAKPAEAERIFIING